VDLDVESLERATGRTFTAAERSEIVDAQQRSYRWTFLVSGLEHPKFTEIVDALTSEGRRKVDTAAEALAA
jgi:hypothetical protein